VSKKVFGTLLGKSKMIEFPQLKLEPLEGTTSFRRDLEEVALGGTAA